MTGSTRLSGREYAASRAGRLGRWWLGGVVVLAVAVGVAAPAAAQSGYVLERRWGGATGSGPAEDGKFATAVGGLATDAVGNVYATDPGGNRIQKFTPTGEFILQWAAPDPQAIATDAAGNVYASRRARIYKFSSAGVAITEWSIAGSENEYLEITDLATDGAGNVYATNGDMNRGSVQKFSASGRPITTWTTTPQGRPAGIATDAAGHVYVSDGGIAKFTPDGELIRRWSPTQGSGLGRGWSGPLAVDAAGAVYVTQIDTDEYFNSIQSLAKLSSSGQPIASWELGRTCWWFYDCGGQPTHPLEADRAGNVYVEKRSFVEKYAPAGSPQPTPTPTATPTPTPTPSPTPTPTPSPTPTSTPSATPTSTPTPSPSPSPGPTGCAVTNSTDVPIPDLATVESPITIAGCEGSASTSATVEVHLEHTYIGDLVVTLVAADGSTHLLHNRGGGSTDNIDQTYAVNLSSEQPNGTWKLRVQDAAAADVGRIDSWTINLAPSTTATCRQTNGTDVTIADHSTVESSITIADCQGNASPAATVEVHIFHTYIGDLVLTLIAPDGSTYPLHNRTGGSADNIDQPYTVNLSSEPRAGTWRLRVQDAATADVGRIDSWTLSL